MENNELLKYLSKRLDIKGIAKYMNFLLSEEQSIGIVKDILTQYNSGVSVTWEIIEYHINNIRFVETFID